MIGDRELASRRAALLRLLPHDGAIVVFSGEEKVSSADATYPFEVNRNYHYLTGLNEPGGVLLLVKSEGNRSEYLFVPPFDEKKEKWYGKRYSFEEARERSGIQNVLSSAAFQGALKATLNPDEMEHGYFEDVYFDFDREIKVAEETSCHDFIEATKKEYPGYRYHDVYPYITTLRLRKSAAEISELKFAIEATRKGIYGALSKMVPDNHEYEVADAFLHIINDENGYEGESFETIMASGKNATILHYPRPMGELKDGDMLLMDLGARKNLYCADISRTWPINGKFTETQRKYYQIVLNANKMVISLARPGVTIADLQKATQKYLSEELIKAGLIEKEDDLIKYYFHNVSHFIGLDTHDPYKSIEGDVSYRDVPLEPGMVISDEPGLYIPELGLGIRIEDDLYITESGCVNLSESIVKEIADVERLLSARYN